VFHSACFAEACSGSTRARGVDPPAKRQGPVARPTYNADPPLSDLTMLACVLQAPKTPSRNGGPFYGPNRGGPTFSNSRSKIKLRRNRVKNTPQGFTLLLLTQAPPPLYPWPSSHPMGPFPSPPHLAQTFLMYTYNNNLINDSSNKLNLTKNNTKRVWRST
jgi:hypothetical protein